MYQTAVGFKPEGRLLSGLNTKGPAGAMAKGMAMSAAADAGLKRETQNQEFGASQAQKDSQLRQQAAGIAAQSAQNASKQRMGSADLGSQGRAFDISMQSDYAQLRKRQEMNIRQALLNQFAREA